MRTRNLLLIIALVTSSVSTADGATAQVRSDQGMESAQLVIAPDRSNTPQIDLGAAPDIFVWNGTNGESSVAEAGVWGSIKGGVKKVAKAVATAGKRAGTGIGSAVKKAAKVVAKSPLGEGIKRTAANLKKFGTQTYQAGKKYLLHRD